jgi:hypothetical protein
MSSIVLTRSPQHPMVCTLRPLWQDLHESHTNTQAGWYHPHETRCLDRSYQRAALARHCSVCYSHLLALPQEQDYAHRSRDGLGEARHGCHGCKRRDETSCWWCKLDVGEDGPRAGGGLDFCLSVLPGRRCSVMVDEMRYDTLVLCFSIALVSVQPFAKHMPVLLLVQHTVP